MSSNTSRFFKLEMGGEAYARKQREFELLDETGKAIVGEDGKIHVAKQLQNLPGSRMSAKSKEILEDVASGYKFEPPPMERELMLCELRTRMWAEEDRKQAARLRGENPIQPHAPAVARDPEQKRASKLPRWKRNLERAKTFFKSL